MKQPPPPPVDLYGVLVPGMEMAIRASVDRLNTICQMLGQPLFNFGRNGSATHEYAPNDQTRGTPRYWTDEQKLATLREYDQQPTGTGAQWLRDKGLNYQHVFSWRKKLGTPTEESAAPLEPSPFPTPSSKRREWTDEQKREFMGQYQALPENSRERGNFLRQHKVHSSAITRWRREGYGKKKAPSKANRESGASHKDIATWAKKHKGVFDVNAFHAANPGVHVRGIGLMVREEKLKMTDEKKRLFELTPKGEALLNV